MPKLRRIRSVAAVLAAAALYLVHSYPAIRQYGAGWLEDREAEERYSRYRALRALSSTPCRYSPARHHPALAVWTRRDVAEVYQQLEAGCRDTGSYEAAVEVLYSIVQYSTVQCWLVFTCTVQCLVSRTSGLQQTVLGVVVGPEQGGLNRTVEAAEWSSSLGIIMWVNIRA